MEAVAAVGVAAAAVQFLDYSIKTLTLCKEIRDSPSGSTKANEELTVSINKLTAMQKDLRKNSNAASSTYRQLIRAVQDCAAVSTELLQLLEHIRDRSRKSAGVMRAAWQAMKKRKTVERLQDRLADCQTKYHLALTTDMRDEVLRLLEDQGKNTKSIHDLIMQRFDFTRDQIQALDRNITRSAGAAQKQLSALCDRQQKASASLRRGQRDIHRNMNSQFSKLSISTAQQDFLDSLYFPEMFARQESMKKTSPGTYNWVFKSKVPLSDDEDEDEDDSDDEYYYHREDKELRGRILRWLRETSEPPVFWISGKPGSGKSSLVSFILSDERTRECLKAWARNRVPYIFSFFFWKPGSMLQKTMTGYMRSMVWQLCKARPSIITQLVSQDTSLSYSPWTEAKLNRVLRFALSAYRNDPLFFLIDGLDECEDDHSDMLDELQGLNTNLHTKVCISSRPEQVFCKRLEALPSVRLQDLNYGDIFKYAHTRLRRGDGRTKMLERDVASNAEGVFLWAVLVCESLCSGLMAEDDQETLSKRLRAYPKGLDDLFDRMFATLEEIHYESLALYFYAARQFQFSVALAVASQPRQSIESLEHFGAMCAREVTRITQQSRGLLQVSPNRFVPDDGHYDCAWSLKDIRTGCSAPYPLYGTAFRLAKQHLALRIQFVHRSAYDYIFGDQRVDHLMWLKSFDVIEIVRKVLNGGLWLAQYGPILHMAAGQLRSTTTLNWILGFEVPADDVLKVDQEWFGNELEKLLDSLHSWTAVMHHSNQLSQHTTLMEADDACPQDLQVPLRLFWEDILQISPDFVASHLHRLWDRDDACLNVAALINSWYRGRNTEVRYRGSINSAMSSLATEFVQRQSAFTEAPYAQMQRQRYSMILMQGSVPYGAEREHVSWEALSTYHEASYVLKLLSLAAKIAVDYQYLEPYEMEIGELAPGRPSACNEYMEINMLQAYCVLIQSWRMFYGTPCYNQEILLPLQLSLPMFYKYPPTSRYLSNDEIQRLLLSFREEKRLRLSCFARRGPSRLRRAAINPIPVSPIASYCLSSATTNALLMFSKIGDQHSDQTRFVGSLAEMSGCIELVMNDIWNDAENQLTAWEQLYLSTCVKFYISHFWSRRPSQVEAGWSSAVAEQQAWHLQRWWQTSFLGFQEQKLA